MKTFSKIAIISSAVLSLNACSLMGDDASKINQLDYQAVNKKVVSLEIPPDLRDPRDGDLYSLPQGMTANPDALKAKSEMRQGVLTPVKNARLERSGNQVWLNVGDKSAAELWRDLRVFWQESGFTIASEEPQAGVMETEWAENRAKLPNQGLRKLFETVGVGGLYSTGERDKFLIRMENAGQKGVNIFFSHKGLEEVYDSKNKDSTVWQPRASDANLEAAFLSRFMQYLGAGEEIEQPKPQQLAQNPVTTKTEFAQLEANNVVVFGEAERNITRIGSALDRTGLTVQNFVAERGMFVVQPAEAESEAVRSGSSRTWWGGKKKSEEKVEATKPQMFAVLEALPNGQRIHLMNQNGQPYQGEDKKRLLEKLFQELR